MMVFNLGDVVSMNSGGPKMTIGRITQDAAHLDWYHCSWFNKEYNLQFGNFYQYELILIEEIK